MCRRYWNCGEGSPLLIGDSSEASDFRIAPERLSRLSHSTTLLARICTITVCGQWDWSKIGFQIKLEFAIRILLHCERPVSWKMSFVNCSITRATEDSNKITHIGRVSKGERKMNNCNHCLAWKLCITQSFKVTFYSRPASIGYSLLINTIPFNLHARYDPLSGWYF